MSVYYLQNPASTSSIFPPRAPFHLSPRQLDVLRLLGEGLSNKQIGRLLGITDGTVKQHIQCVLEELGAVNRLQAVIYAYRRGILSPESDPAAVPVIPAAASAGFGAVQSAAAKS